MTHSPAGSARRSRIRRRGRRSWSATDRAQVLAEFTRSGLSIADYCAQSGVAQSTLCYWRRQARETGGAQALRPGRVPGFARVEVEPASAFTAGITAVLRTPAGVAVEFTGLDEAAVGMLLRALVPEPVR